MTGVPRVIDLPRGARWPRNASRSDHARDVEHVVAILGGSQDGGRLLLSHSADRRDVLDLAPLLVTLTRAEIKWIGRWLFFGQTDGEPASPELLARVLALLDANEAG